MKPPPLPEQSKSHTGPLPPPFPQSGGPSGARKSKEPLSVKLLLGLIVAVACLVGARILVIGYTFVKDARYTKIESRVEAPEYTTLIGEHMSGSGFHFVYSNKTYIACSLHQFDDVAPNVMIHLEREEPVKILKRVAKQNDIQILAVQTQDLEKFEALHYEPNEKIERGMPVYLYEVDKPYKGHVSRLGDKGSEFGIRMETPFPAAGNSGSPVISGITGNVIGVMLSADSPENARTVGFERLTWTGEE